MLLYIIVFPFLYLLALLPTDFLYTIARAVAWILEYLVRYRRKVVYANLRKSLPDRSEPEIKAIVHQFYGHFADMMVENIKATSISTDELRQHIDMPGVDAVFKPYWESKRNVVVVLGHCGAWQWSGLSIAELIPQQLYAFYNPLANPYFDNYIRQARSRYGMHLVSMRDYMRHARSKFEDMAGVHFFIFDQGPVNVKKAYWTDFLHQETAFYYGPARFAQEHDCAVLYARVRFISRGRYETTFTEVVADPQSISESEIIERCVRLLEAQILETPADWLWSHRRWKRKRSK